MARKKIKIKDRAIVKKRLIQGYSLVESIKGTAIRSPNTARRIGLEDLHDIARQRKEYVKLMEALGATEYDRAKVMARMIKAKRPHGPKSDLHPDWKARESAIKYIDTLAGFYEDKGPDIKAEIHLDNRRLYVILPPERQRESPSRQENDLLEAPSREADGSPDQD